MAGPLADAGYVYLQAAKTDPNFQNNGALIKAALARLLSGDPSGANHVADQYVAARVAAKDPIVAKNDQWWEGGRAGFGGGARRSPADDTETKYLKALDIQTGKTVWEIPDVGGGILSSGLMATAGARS